MDKKDIDIKIVNRPVLEFANTFHTYCNLEDTIDKFNCVNFEVDKDVSYILDRISEDLSLFVKNEISSLAELNVINFIAIAYISDYSEINTVGDFFEVFDREPLEKCFDYMGGAFLLNFFPDLNEGWGEVKNSISKMKEYIEDIDEIDKILKEKILSLYKYPEETKMRVRYVLEQFYIKGYKQFEDMIIKKCYNESVRYKDLLENNIDNFIEINIKGMDMKPLFNRKINVHISYMQQLGYNLLFNIDKNILDGCVSIGCRNIEYFNNKNLMEDFDKFLKTIADPTRFKIITLIAKRGWYAQALAKEIGVTPATIHHHMENLTVLGIANAQKDDNKILYRLNTHVVEEYIKILQNKIFN